MRISLRRCPPTSALFVDYLESSSRVQAFYPQTYSLESIERFARERQATGRLLIGDVFVKSSPTSKRTGAPVSVE